MQARFPRSPRPPRPLPPRLRPILWLAGSLLAGPAWALPEGMVATIYNGRPPSNLQHICTENAACSVSGIKEVWYGRDFSWRYKQLTGSFACNNDFFSDPYPYSRKECYARDLTEPTPVPPRLALLPVTLQLNDLLTVEGGRFRVNVVLGAQRVAVVAPVFQGKLTALGLPTDPSNTQDYFQINLEDTRAPARQFSLFIAATLQRCVNFNRKADGGMQLSQGRVMELYTLSVQPDAQTIPQRSATERLCTNDKGELTFHIRPPSIDAFQIKVVNHGPAGRPNDVFEYYIPTSLNRVLAP